MASQLYCQCSQYPSQPCPGPQSQDHSYQYLAFSHRQQQTQPITWAPLASCFTQEMQRILRTSNFIPERCLCHPDKPQVLVQVLKFLVALQQEEFEQWEVASRQKEEDSTALEKYHKQDESKAKELGIALEKVTKEVVEQKRKLAEEVTETQAAQIQLDKTAEDFRQGFDLYLLSCPC